MAQMIPLCKMSKKAQKQYHAARRGSWNGVNPVTRTAESKKVYNRQKDKRRTERMDHGSALCHLYRLIFT